jgi:hypothetical protein
MRSLISENQALKRALQDSYFAKERLSTGKDWRTQLMKRVRNIGPLGSVIGFWPAFENLFWRLVPVSCILVVALTVLLLSLGPGFAHDYLGTVTAELDKPTLSELLDFGS